jgi:uncharacterized protein (TIGR03083 family)
MTPAHARPNPTPTDTVPAATGIPATGRQEAANLMQVELTCLIELLECLAPEDWAKPTACTLWNVKDVAAHKAGALAAFASWTELWRQLSPVNQRPYRARGMSQLDAMNQIQVDDRAERTPVELVAELRSVGPRAIRTFQRLPAPVRAIPLPAPPPKGGLMSLAYLTDTIYPRDLWMHRLDLARATGRAFAQAPEHDGRVVALVVRELAQALPRHLGEASVVYELAGPAGGRWRIGRPAGPAATIRMAALDFAQLCSERFRAADVLSRTETLGDATLARRALEHTAVLF